MLIHASGVTTQAWRAMGDAGVTVSLAPTSESQIEEGYAPCMNATSRWLASEAQAA